MPSPIRCFALIFCLGIIATASQAAENFIPRGHSFQPGDSTLPPLNSDQDRIDLQTDLYEAELYVKQRRQKVFESRLNRFQFEQEFNSLNDNPEY
jgi:hypothetical protein